MKIVIWIWSVLFMVGAIAQEGTEQSTSKIKASVGNSEIVIDLTADSWLNPPGGMKIDWFSRGANISLIKIVSIADSRFSVGLGIGLRNNNIYHNSLIGKDSIGQTIFTSTTNNYKVNKFSTAYFDIPLDIRFNSKPDKKNRSFKISVGAKAGYLVSSHIKYNGTDLFGQGYSRYKFQGISNLNNWQYGITSRIGYGSISLFAYYGINSLFSSKGPQSNPISIGLSFSIL